MEQHEPGISRPVKLSEMSSLFLLLFLFSQTTSTLTHSSYKPAVHQQVTIEQTEESVSCSNPFLYFFASANASERNTFKSHTLFSTEYHRSFLRQQHAHISMMRLSDPQQNVLTFRDKRQASFCSRRTISDLSDIPSDHRSA